MIEKSAKCWLIILAVLGLLSVFMQGLLALAKQGERYETRIKEQAIAECNAHWRAEIAKSNVAAAKKQAEALGIALDTEKAAQAKQAEIERELADLETENAKLEQNGRACGFDRGHIRLLNRQTDSANY